MNASAMASRQSLTRACALLFLLCCCIGAVNSQYGHCTKGFFKDINNVIGIPRIVPLPSMDRPNLDFVQWLFPFMRFTCNGRITRWRLRVEERDLDLKERGNRWNIPQLTTWRQSQVQSPISPFQITSYERVSTTNETPSTVMNKGSVYEYDLPTPVEVKPGDIVGIHMPLNMIARHSWTTKPLFLDLVRGNASTSSHSKRDNSTVVVIPPPEIIKPLQTFIPLISVVVEGDQLWCTTGFLEDITDTGGEAIPLPSTNRPNLDFVQWLFPFMSFTCVGKITQWMLRIEQRDLDLEEDDRWNIPQLSTWRPIQVQEFPGAPLISYELASITNATLSTVIDQGSVYEYNLPIPIAVEPGHIVGIQMPLGTRERQSRSSRLLFWQLVNGNTSTLSYSSLQNRSTVIPSPFEIAELSLMFIPLISVYIEPLDAPINTPSVTSEVVAGGEGELVASARFIAGITSGTGLAIVLAVIMTTTITVMAISYSRYKKKKDKTGNQVHHTSPLYDTIPEPNNDNIVSRQAIVTHNHSISERLDRGNGMMQQPNLIHHPMRHTRLEGHNNVFLEGSQRARESIQTIPTTENEAYTYILVDQHVHVPVQETNPEEYINVYPGRKEAEDYTYPVTNKWVHIKQKD